MSQGIADGLQRKRGEEGRAPRRGRWRYWVVIALWSVVLGAVTNYATVWSIIRYGPAGWRASLNSGTKNIYAPDFTFTVNGVAHEVVVDRTAWSVESQVRVVTGTMPDYPRKPVALAAPAAWMVVPSTLQRSGGWNNGGEQSTTSRTRAYGLPFVCLMHTEGLLYDQTGAARLWRESFWQVETDRSWRHYEFPLMPVWPGFLANTAVFAAAWAAVIRVIVLPLYRGLAGVWSWIERRIEASQRGKCIKCGYPRTGIAEPHTPCPECGSRQF